MNAHSSTVAAALFAAALLIVAYPVAAADCVKVQVTADGAEADGGAAKFAASEILDLTLTVLFKDKLAGEHLLEVRVFTPGGYLYRSISIPFALDGSAKGKRKIPGYPDPIELESGYEISQAHGRFLALDITLPVAGTDIVGEGIYGRWQVDARIDGARNPCSQASFFELR